MLFTENDLNYVNALDLLEEATYLSEDESIINPATIPVKEVKRLGYGVVRFDDVDKLSEDYGIDYIDAMYAIAEASDMDPEHLAVSVPEEDIIAYPEIVNELANIVVQPLSENDFEYQYVDMCLEAWDNTGDESYLEAIVEDYYLEECANILLEEINADYELDETRPFGYKKWYGKPYMAVRDTVNNVGAEYKDLWQDLKQGARGTKVNLSGDRDKHGIVDKTAWERVKGVGSAFGKHKAATAGAVAAAGAAGYGVYKFANWVKEARNKPKSWIGKKIAALRSIYQKWMQQAQKNPKKAGMIKSACAKLLSIIDALMAKLQNAVG